LGIVTACQSEAALVRRCLHLQYRDTTPAGRLWSGDAYGQDIVLLRSGMGAERATHAATWLVQHYALHGLLSVGFAGGLQAALATGDTLLPQQVLSWSGDLEGESAIKTASLYTDAGLARLATLSANQAHLRQHQGTLLTVPEVLRHHEAASWATLRRPGSRYGILQHRSGRGGACHTVYAPTDDF
jgi:nucleoside phosphorylase